LFSDAVIENTNYSGITVSQVDDIVGRCLIHSKYRKTSKTTQEDEASKSTASAEEMDHSLL